MRMYDIITKKKYGKVLTKEEIDYFINGYVKGSIPDYQISALMMAIYFKGLNKEETLNLTMAMVNSGDKVNLDKIDGIKVDKHSTGGVGDTVTLIAAPLAAACGATVAKMSGRGLGHTGGTLDKLETIPKFNVFLDKNSFVDIVNSIKLSIIGQTANLVPADKKLYSLRDVTSTVDNLSLIASSIMSKKIASGCDALVLDVKAGSGAFMKDIDDAFKLAKEMVDIGVRAGIKTNAVVTDMNQPLGTAVGNALEVQEAIEILNGKHLDSDLALLSINIASHMLLVSSICSDIDEAKKKVIAAIKSGKGSQKLKEMIKMQHGDTRVVDNSDILPKAKRIIKLESKTEGYITNINTEQIGTCAMLLGAGRINKEDSIDGAVGLVMKKRINDYMKKGDIIAELHVNSEDNLNKAINLFNNSITTKKNKVDKKLIYGMVDRDGIKYY